ncbi:MAG TPA: M61 family peptidase, partial [Terriglobales bacterium]|nr:M61 family peptidase [Terriglobales bacterium]
MISVRCYGLLIAILVTPSFFAAQTTPQSAPPTITVSVDATDAQRKIFHAHLTIPATPGSLTLYYPKWIPGEHGPTGPIEELTGLRFTGNGQVLNWRRDLLDGWTFHVDVPQGVSLVEASLDYVSPTGRDGLYTGALSATDKITEIAWNTLILYPAGWTSDELSYETTLRLPTGWKSGTALPIASQSGPEIKFKPASLTTLVDSPLIAGEYMRVVPLA